MYVLYYVILCYSLTYFIIVYYIFHYVKGALSARWPWLGAAAARSSWSS